MPGSPDSITAASPIAPPKTSKAAPTAEIAVILQTPLEKLELSPRTLNSLKRAHLRKVGEVLELNDDELFRIRNFGVKSLTEPNEKLKGLGYSRGEEDSEESAESAEPAPEEAPPEGE